MALNLDKYYKSQEKLTSSVDNLRNTFERKSLESSPSDIHKQNKSFEKVPLKKYISSINNLKTTQKRLISSVDNLKNSFEKTSPQKISLKKSVPFKDTTLERDKTRQKKSFENVSLKKSPLFKDINKKVISGISTVFKTTGTEFFTWLKDGFGTVFSNIQSAYSNIMGNIHTTFIAPFVDIGKSIKKSFTKFFLRQDKKESQDRGKDKKGMLMKLISGALMILGIAIGIFAAKLKVAADIILAPVRLLEKALKVNLLGKTGFFGKITKFFGRIGVFFKSLGKMAKNPLLQKIISGFKLGMLKKVFWPIQVIMSIVAFISGFKDAKGDIKDKIVGGLKSVFEGLISIVVDPFAWVVNKFRAWMGFEEIPKLGEKIINVLFMPIEKGFRLFVWLGEKSLPILKKIGESIGGFFRLIGNISLLFWNFEKWLFKLYKKGIKLFGEGLGNVIRYIADIGSKIVSFIITFNKNLINIISTVSKKIKDKIGEKFNNIIEKAISHITSIGSIVGNFFKKLKNKVFEYIPFVGSDDSSSKPTVTSSKLPISNLPDDIIAGRLKGISTMGNMSSRGLKSAIEAQTKIINNNKMQYNDNNYSINSQSNVVAPTTTINNDEILRSYDPEVDSLNFNS